MTQRRYHPNQWLSMVILLASLVHKTCGFPYMRLKANESKKCVVAAYPPGSKLTIDYDFLDFENKQKDITISIKPVQRDGTVPGSGILGRLATASRQKISVASGNIKYNKALDPKSLADHDLEVCVDTSGFSRNSAPILFSLKFREVIDDEFNIEFGKISKDNSAANGEDQKLAKEHMTYMEKQVFNMVSDTDMLIGGADISKEEEAQFSQKSIDMNSAAKWWPIIHLLVLFVTGYTQANHIISFFKSRHII